MTTSRRQDGDMSNDAVIDRTEYPPGVPCWIDTEQPDPESTAEFYGGSFGWEFENKLPPGIDDKYLVASLQGFDVAAIAIADAGPVRRGVEHVRQRRRRRCHCRPGGRARRRGRPRARRCRAAGLRLPAGGLPSSTPKALPSGCGSPGTATARSW